MTKALGIRLYFFLAMTVLILPSFDLHVCVAIKTHDGERNRCSRPDPLELGHTDPLVFPLGHG